MAKCNPPLGQAEVIVVINAAATHAEAVHEQNLASLGQAETPAAALSQAEAHAITSTLSRAEYCAGVRRIIDYIWQGDIYQANLTHRLAMATNLDGWSLYQRLATASPAPFSAFMQCGDFQLASSSPEQFLQLSGSQVTTRPIKGTRPRGATPDLEGGEGGASAEKIGASGDNLEKKKENALQRFVGEKIEKLTMQNDVDVNKKDQSWVLISEVLDAAIKYPEIFKGIILLNGIYDIPSFVRELPAYDRGLLTSLVRRDSVKALMKASLLSKVAPLKSNTVSYTHLTLPTKRIV